MLIFLWVNPNEEITLHPSYFLVFDRKNQGEKAKNYLKSPRFSETMTNEKEVNGISGLQAGKRKFYNIP